MRLPAFAGVFTQALRPPLMRVHCALLSSDPRCEVVFSFPSLPVRFVCLWLWGGVGQGEVLAEDFKSLFGNTDGTSDWDIAYEPTSTAGIDASLFYEFRNKVKNVSVVAMRGVQVGLWLRRSTLPSPRTQAPPLPHQLYL